MNAETLFLKRSEVRALLTLPECIEAMERAFTMRAQGQALTPALMHVDADGGEFRNAEFILQPKGDINVALQNLRGCDRFSRV